MVKMYHQKCSLLVIDFLYNGIRSFFLGGTQLKKNKWLKIILGIISILLIINIVAGLYFYNLVIERNVKDFLVGNVDLEVTAEAMDLFLDGDWREWVAEQDYEEMELTSDDGIKLQGE